MSFAAAMRVTVSLHVCFVKGQVQKFRIKSFWEVWDLNKMSGFESLWIQLLYHTRTVLYLSALKIYLLLHGRIITQLSGRFGAIPPLNVQINAQTVRGHMSNTGCVNNKRTAELNVWFQWGFQSDCTFHSSIIVGLFEFGLVGCAKRRLAASLFMNNKRSHAYFLSSTAAV